MWDEMETAAEVVRRGTVSAAAEALGVHRSTINRRIDAMEAYLGGKLFQRHKRGYTPTELARDLVKVSDESVGRLERLRRRALAEQDALRGNLIVTTIEALTPFLLQKIAEFTALHPDVMITFRVSGSLFRLELGEAHVAFRVGMRPEEPDYVVLPHKPVRLGLFASQKYIAQYGRPEADTLNAHRYVLLKGIGPPEFWLQELVTDPDIVLFADKEVVTETAIKAGVGIGFVPISNAENDPALVEVVPPRPAWQVPAWIVTHVDLHRSPKVQAFLAHCRCKGERG